MKNGPPSPFLIFVFFYQTVDYFSYFCTQKFFSQIIFTMILLIIVLLVTLSFPKQLQLTYNHTTKVILFYQQNSQPVPLSLTFQHKDISLHESLKDKQLFFSRQGKNKILNLPQHAKYDYKMKMALKSKKNNEIMGSIGLDEGSQFYQLLKETLNASSVKIEVRHKEGMMRVLAQSCTYPIFLPLMLTLSESNTHSYSVEKFSTNFHPDSTFLKVINKAKSPFTMTKQQTQLEVTVSLRDRVISVPLTELIECGKYSNSDSYECEMQDKKQPDVGGLIFDFDPTLCGNAIEFEAEPESSWGYHYSHLVLLVLQFCLLGCLLRAERVKNLMNKALNLKFS